MADYLIFELSNGTLIQEDKTPGFESFWLRMRKHMASSELKIAQLRLFYNGKEYSTSRNASGYFHSRAVGRILESGFSMFKMYGIGHIENNIARILWVHDDGTTHLEDRPITKANLAVIFNDKI